MARKQVYPYSELISFFAEYNPPEYLNQDCPVFTPEFQSPLDYTNFVPITTFSSKPFHEGPKAFQPKTSATNWKPQKIIDFHPTSVKRDNQASNQNVSSAPSLPDQQNKYEFKPVSIAQPSEPSQQTENIKKSSESNGIEVQKQENEIQNQQKEAQKEEINKKPRQSNGFRPQKAQQKYEAPEYNSNQPKAENSNQHKNVPNFNEIEKEEKFNQPPKQSKPERKSFFDSIYEEEKKNSQKTSVEPQNKEKETKNQPVQSGGFRPKPANNKFEGLSLSEIESAQSKAPKKSAFESLMEEERENEEKIKKQKEQEKRQPKPSLIDMLIEEEKRNQAKAAFVPPPPIPEEKERRPTQGFNPKKATNQFEALSIAELERIEKEKQKQEQEEKRKVYAESLSNTKKQSFNELQQQELANNKKKPTGPSFLDLIESEQQQQKIENAKEKRIEVEQKKEAEKRSFNPKRRNPIPSSNGENSFAALLNQEKENQAKMQPKVAHNASVTVQVGTKRNANVPSFSELMMNEQRKEEERAAAPVQQILTTQSFSQKLEEAKNAKNIEEHQTSLGDFVSYQGDNRRKRGGKTNKKRGRNGDTNTEHEDFFWGAVESAAPVDDGENQWPSLSDSNQTENTDFGFKEHRRQPQAGDDKASWLAKILEDELGEDNPYEFAESLVNKSKKEMIRFLSTVTIDQHQAMEIADRFFRRFPSK